jgi:hypothetical protein
MGLFFWSARSHLSWGPGDTWYASVLDPDEGEADEEGLIGALVGRGAHRLPHTGGRPFVKHITGVGQLLEHWGQPRALCLAGVAHSVYSTEMYPCALFSPCERGALRRLVRRARAPSPRCA